VGGSLNGRMSGTAGVKGVRVAWGGVLAHILVPGSLGWGWSGMANSRPCWGCLKECREPTGAD
jgi:hypothetical protein